MNFKTFVLFLFVSTFALQAQNLTVSDKVINFGTSEKELIGTPWQDGGQIESEYPYINTYEGSLGDYSVYGYFIDNILVCVDVSTCKEAYPTIEEIEKILAGFEPYKNELKDVGAPELNDYYKTDVFYICVSGVRMCTNYKIIPIELFDKIRKKYKEFLREF